MTDINTTFKTVFVNTQQIVLKVCFTESPVFMLSYVLTDHQSLQLVWAPVMSGITV